MATYTITTTDQQEAALTWAYERSRVPVSVGGVAVPPVPDQTQAEFLQAQVDQFVLTPLVTAHHAAQNVVLVGSLATIPPENRETAAAEIVTVIETSGGEIVRG